MPGLIIDGVAYEIPGLATQSWKDDPRLRLKMGEDGKARTKGTWIRSIVLHTTLGIPGGTDNRAQVLHLGTGGNANTAFNVNRFWSTTATSAGAHLIVDFDGSVYCLADLATEVTYHATSINDVSIGIEIAQKQSDASLYQAELESVVKLVDFLTAHFGIQRQYHSPYKGVVPRLQKGGKDCVGIFGHRDQSMSRGRGDPGDFVMKRLGDAGYEAFDFGKGEDLEMWNHRQHELARYGCYKAAVDGVPGPFTVDAIRQTGRPSGLWVEPNQAPAA